MPVTENGCNALQLIESPPVETTTLTRAAHILEANFGADYPAEKFTILFDMIREAGWSEARFTAVFKWFLQNKKFPNWTIADWFEYGIKVYPESWYHKKCSESYNPLPHLDRYRLPDGTIVYREKDGQIIPHLEKL